MQALVDILAAQGLTRQREHGQWRALWNCEFTAVARSREPGAAAPARHEASRRAGRRDAADRSRRSNRSGRAQRGARVGRATHHLDAQAPRMRAARSRLALQFRQPGLDRGSRRVSGGRVLGAQLRHAVLRRANDILDRSERGGAAARSGDRDIRAATERGSRQPRARARRAKTTARFSSRSRRELWGQPVSQHLLLRTSIDVDHR